MRVHRSPLLFLCLGFGAVCATLLAQEPLPPVYFNHITIFLSPAAYAAIRESPFLQNEFSAFHERTVQRDGGKWSYTGIFITGQHTYLEFFQAGQGAPFGTTIAGQIVFNMWIDDRTQLPRFRDRLAAESSATLLIDTARNAQNATTYDAVVSPGGPASDFGLNLRVDTYIKGYYPDGITREKRIGEGFRAERQLHDITGFTLTVDEQERRRLIQQFRAYSYHMNTEGANQIVSGPEITFTFVRAKLNAPRTLTIDFSVNHSTSGERTDRLGEGGDIQLKVALGPGCLLSQTPRERGRINSFLP